MYVFFGQSGWLKINHVRIGNSESVSLLYLKFLNYNNCANDRFRFSGQILSRKIAIGVSKTEKINELEICGSGKTISIGNVLCNFYNRLKRKNIYFGPQTPAFTLCSDDLFFSAASGYFVGFLKICFCFEYVCKYVREKHKDPCKGCGPRQKLRRKRNFQSSEVSPRRRLLQEINVPVQFKGFFWLKKKKIHSNR